MWRAWWRKKSLHKVSLAQKFAGFAEHWSPKIAAELNGQQVKLVKFQGDFVWHHHANEDEMFLVVRGAFRMDYIDMAGAVANIDLNEGEFLVVPRGMEHKPCAEHEVEVMLFEPAGTLNTGNVRDELTLDQPEVLV